MSKMEMDLDKKYGRLKIVSETDKGKRGCTRFLCICDCGNERIAQANQLRAGLVKSCGCLVKRSNKGISITGNKQHGNSGKGKASDEYKSWTYMKRRCYDMKHDSYASYGAIGVVVCDRWMESFDNFLSDMGNKPSPEHTLDRYPKSNGNYEPSNCRWATQAEQSMNKVNSRNYEYKGIIKSFRAWGRVLKFCVTTVDNKIKKTGLSIQQIFEEYQIKNNIVL